MIYYRLNKKILTNIKTEMTRRKQQSPNIMNMQTIIMTLLGYK